MGCAYNISVNRNSLLAKALLFSKALDKSEIFVYNIGAR